MGSGLALWQIGLLAGPALVGLLYVFAFRLGPGAAPASDVLCLLALTLAVAGVTTPTAFDRAAGALVARSSLPPALRSLDERVAAIETLPRRIVDRALARIGFSSETGDAEADGAAGTGDDAAQAAGQDGAPDRADGAFARGGGDPRGPTLDAPDALPDAVPDAPPIGPFEARIRPAFEGFVALALRAAAFCAGTLLALLALAMRIATLAWRRARRLAERVERLERYRASAPSDSGGNSSRIARTPFSSSS